MQRHSELNSFCQNLSQDQHLVVLLDAKGTILEASPKWAKTYGYSLDELKGMHFSALLKETSQADFSHYLDVLNKSGALFNAPLVVKSNRCFFEILIFAKSLNQTASPKFIAECRTLEYYMQSKTAIEELLVKERFLSSSHALRADITALSLNTKSSDEFLDALQSCLQGRDDIKSYIQTKQEQGLNNSSLPVKIAEKAVDLEPDSVQETISSEDLRAGILTLEITLSDPAVEKWCYVFELQIQTFEILMSPWIDSLQDCFNQVHICLENIHDESVIQQTQDKLRAIVENVNAIGFEIDLENRVFQYLSPKIEQLLGYQKSEWHDLQQWLALVHHEDRVAIKNQLIECKPGNHATHITFRIRHKNGYFVWLLAHITFEDRPKRIPRALGVLVDLTEQKKIEHSLENAVAQANQLNQEQQTFLSLFDMGDIVLFKWRNNENWSVDYVSLSVERLLGYCPNEFIKEGKLYGNCIHPHDLQRVLDEVQNAIDSNQTFFRHQPYRIVDKHNQVKWVSDITYILRDSSHEIINFIGYVYDITIEHDAHFQLQSILNMQDNIIIVTNGDRIQFANQTFLEFFSVPSLQAFLSEHACICDLFVKYQDHYRSSSNQSNWLMEIQKRPEADRIVTLENSQKQLVSFKVQINLLSETSSVVSFTDITETLKERDYFQYLSMHDQLTGSYNREYLLHKFNKLVAAAKRNNQKLAVIMVDIDLFKKVNDQYGHNIGDEVLHGLAQLFNENIRIHDRLVRWGGEEFVLIAEVDSIDAGSALAEHLRYLTEQKNFKNDQQQRFSVTASFGVTLATVNDSLKTAVERADNALYAAKESGRNQVNIA